MRCKRAFTKSTKEDQKSGESFDVCELGLHGKKITMVVNHG